jgi:hypothetical protein
LGLRGLEVDNQLEFHGLRSHTNPLATAWLSRRA